MKLRCTNLAVHFYIISSFQTQTVLKWLLCYGYCNQNNGSKEWFKRDLNQPNFQTAGCQDYLQNIKHIELPIRRMWSKSHHLKGGHVRINEYDMPRLHTIIGGVYGMGGRYLNKAAMPGGLWGGMGTLEVKSQLQ